MATYDGSIWMVMDFGGALRSGEVGTSNKEKSDRLEVFYSIDVFELFGSRELLSEVAVSFFSPIRL